MKRLMTSTLALAAFAMAGSAAAQDKVKLNEATAEDALAEVQDRVQSQLQRYC